VRATWLSLIVVGAGACTKPAPPPNERSAPSAVTSVAPTPGALALVAEQSVPGLRVRSGTLTALGTTSGLPSPWGFSDLAVELAHARLELVPAPRGAALAELLPRGALAIVNGGYFEADFRPSTWVVSAGVELSKKSDTSKGGVLALSGDKLFIGPFSGLGFEPSLAVQSFPLVVEADGKPGIHRDDGRRAARTVACLVGAELHFIVISAPRGEGPTLFETASLLREPLPRGFGCRVALNLDGGPSSGVWFAPEVGARQRAPFANVGYGLAIVPR
jgi:hypothetical protein